MYGSLLRVYQDSGHGDYIGEPISQLAHAQQAAFLAKEAGADPPVILGAFFHDIGHLCAPPESPEMAGLGRLHHERIGADFLRAFGLGGTTADLVELHVQAKRYLCWKNPRYEARLSEASRGTLAFQGGRMGTDEALAFENHPLFREVLRLRSWDEGAKVPGGRGLSLREIDDMLQSCAKGVLSERQLGQWHENGYLHLPGFFGDGVALSTWAEELSSWPETPGKWMKYFESASDGRDARMLCRVENFLEFHPGWASVLSEPRLLAVLEVLFGEPACLFKEKLNFKLPGGNGFQAHQDAPAFSAFGQIFHITAMISIDASTLENGCLEMAARHHQRGLLELNESQVLTKQATDALPWTPLPTQPGDLVLFGSFIPHRSGSNDSEAPRRAAYITYNRLSEGSRRQDYYRTKRATFPPEVERVPGRDYSDSGIFNIGNPIRE